jgi:hypothetical protein
MPLLLLFSVMTDVPVGVNHAIFYQMFIQRWPELTACLAGGFYNEHTESGLERREV